MNQNQRREYLRNRDLEMSKQIERTIKDAQPKPKPDIAVKLLKPIQINNDLITGTPQYKAEKQISDLLLAQQIDNTVKLAMYAVDGKTPEPTKSSITQEMMDDYKKEILKPVTIGDQMFLYSPVDMPALPGEFEPDDLTTDPPMTEEEYMTSRNDILEKIDEHRANLAALEIEQRELRGIQNSGGNPASYDESSRRAALDDPTITNDDLKRIIKGFGKAIPRAPNQQKLIDRIIEIEKEQLTKRSLSQIQADLKAIKVEINQEIRSLRRAEADYRILEGVYKTQLDEIEANRLKELEFNNQKRQLADELLNDFNRLNQGKIKISRDPAETDDDFFARLQSLGAIPVDKKAIDTQVQTEIFIKAKKNISELTNDLSKSETVVKMLDNDERFEMNKIFPMIKAKYIESFGINNKDIDANEMTQFIRNKLETGEALVTPITTTEKQEMKTKLRQFKKPQLEAIIDELNRDNPALGLKKGLVREMVAELDSRDLYDAPKFRSLLKMPDPLTSVAPIMPVVPTSSLSADSEYPTETAPSSVLADKIAEQTAEQSKQISSLIAAQTAQSSQTSSLLASVTKLISSLSTGQIVAPAPAQSVGPAITLTADQTEGLSAKDIEARKAHLEAVERNRARPKLFELDAPPTLKKKAKPKTEANIDTLQQPLSPTQAYNAKKAAAKPEEAKLTPMQEAMMKRRAQVAPDENQKQNDDDENFKEEPIKDKYDIGYPDPLINAAKKKSGRGLSGHGINNHVLPSIVPFGKIALDLDKLFYQNVLSIKRHNGNKIIGHKNKRVSDNFVDIILKMFENKPITQSDLKNIKDEQMLYDNLIVQSGLHKLKKIPTNIEQTSEQMKNRLGLITGEIEAGNSNKALLSELHELLFKMVRVHLISKNAAAAYYKNIKDQFFNL